MNDKELEEYLKRKSEGKVTLKDYEFSDWLLYHLEHNNKFQFIFRIIFQIVIPITMSVSATLIVMKKISPLLK